MPTLARARRIIWQRMASAAEVNRPGRNRRRTIRRLIVMGLCLGIGLALQSRRDDRVAADRFEGARFVTDFALKDMSGKLVTPESWRAYRAVVVIALGADDPEIARIATTFRERQVGFFGVSPSPIRPTGFDFPILLDPSHELIGAAGLHVTPEAAVIDPDGLVVYRGSVSGVPAALDATLKGRMPEVRARPAQGSSLPDPAPLISIDEKVTYSTHIAPILREHCVECHRPGQVGPFSLLTYHDAAKRASFLHEVTDSGQMPPWKAMRGWGTFFDAHHLTHRDLALLDRWAESGAPEGDSTTPAPPIESPEWQLGSPDLILTMAEPYAVAATGDDWRGFVLPGQLTDGRAIAAVEYKPGNRKVAHHARVFIDATDYSRKLDADCPGIGFSYDGRFDIPRPALVEWGPGMKLRTPPEGVAKPVKPGSDVVLLLHYHGRGKPETDQSSVGLYFAKTPPTRIMAMHTLSSNRIDIPPGEARHREVARSTVQHDIKAYSVFPHGHNLLREMKLTATLPDGQVRRMLWIKDWNFAWQTQYYYTEPISLPRGTKLEVLALYDNSPANSLNPNKPPKRVKYGPSSDEEMLGCHLYVVADDEAGDQYYRRKWEDAR